MSRYIDIEPYEKDGWYLQKRYHNSYGEVIKTTPLVSVPTADAEPTKHGKWIEVSDGSGYVGEPCEACSICGMQTDYPSNFCPNCGAKMDLDEVEE